MRIEPGSECNGLQKCRMIAPSPTTAQVTNASASIPYKYDPQLQITAYPAHLCSLWSTSGFSRAGSDKAVTISELSTIACHPNRDCVWTAARPRTQHRNDAM